MSRFGPAHQTGRNQPLAQPPACGGALLSNGASSLRIHVVGPTGLLVEQGVGQVGILQHGLGQVSSAEVVLPSFPIC